MLSSLTMLATYVVLGLPVGAIGIPWTLLTGDIAPLYRWSMRVVRAGVRLARIRVQIEGREHIPAQPSIFMSNHVSNLDPPIMLPFLPFRTAFFIKRSLLKIPVVGYGMRLAGFIPVDRDGRLESARESVQAANKVLESGVNISTFPEGTRSRNGKLLPFKKGPFYLAIECGVPVVPVTITGTHYLMPKGRFAIKPGLATVTFHTPIEPADFGSRECLMEKVRAVIDSGLPEECRTTPSAAARA